MVHGSPEAQGAVTDSQFRCDPAKSQDAGQPTMATINQEESADLIASVNHPFVWSGVNGRPAWTAPAIEGNFSTVALDVHLKDRGVVHQAIDRRQRHWPTC